MMTTRRRFLQTAALTTAALSADNGLRFLGSPAVLGAEKNKKYRLALVGSGWWGKNIFNAAMASKTVEPVAVVDVDKRQLETGVKAAQDAMGIEPKRFTDYREMLEQVKPEIVINATPDHWHPLVAIAAVHAGAHVYVEKPISHTVNEGIAMVKAARETNCKIQVGTHRRVSPHNQQAIEFLHSGKAGDIGHIRVFVHYQGGAGSPAPDTPVPEGLDWDFWCGPAPLVPFNPRIHPKGFRNFLNFGNGQLGDWGIHWLDQVMWWAGDNVYPKSVASTGGRFIAKDNSDGPDTQTAVYQFDKFDMEWEHRRYSGNPPEKHHIGIYFYGTKGTLHLGWQDGWTFYPSKDTDGVPAEHGDPKLDKPDDQNIAGLWTDFIDSIEKDRLPCCDIEKGHRSTTLALLGMLSLKLGRGIVWDGEKQTIPNDPEACKLLSREYRQPWKYPV